MDVIGKILILGASSFVGSHIINQGIERHEIIGTSRDGSDNLYKYDASTPFGLIKKLVSLDDIDVVINCITMGDVDKCEVDRDIATRLNLDFVKELSSELPGHIKLIHLSSNAIYDGLNPLYSESEPKNPINYYGHLKAEADNYVASTRSNYAIIRPITMIGTRLPSQRHNPFSFFARELMLGNDITAVNDVYVNFLDVKYLIKAIECVIKKNLYGEFNISGDEVLSRYEFVALLKRLLGSDSIISSVKSADFKTIAPRPLNTSFDNSKMKKVLGIQVNSLESDLVQMIKEGI